MDHGIYHFESKDRLLTEIKEHNNRLFRRYCTIQSLLFFALEGDYAIENGTKSLREIFFRRLNLRMKASTKKTKDKLKTNLY